MTPNSVSGQANFTPDIGMVRALLNLLFQDLGDMKINARRFGGGFPDSKLFDSIDLVCDWIEKQGQPADSGYYVGVCPRRSDAKNGEKEWVAEVRFLWADLDGKDFEGGMKEALARLRSFPLKPLIIIDSGHGYHAYWPLATPIQLDGPETVAYGEGFLKRLAAYLNADPKVAQIGCVLRLPGTYNLKKKPKTCKLATFVDL